jgi:antitoxin component YwqK of YwqJK toxin-antitoxin module
MSDNTILVIGTLAVVAIVLIACYVVETKIKSYIESFANKRDDTEAKSLAKVASNAATAFEEALKQSFNEAIEDGVITKAEALNIVTTSFEAVKNEIIKNSIKLINNESLDDTSTESSTEDDGVVEYTVTDKGFKSTSSTGD